MARFCNNLERAGCDSTMSKENV